MCREYGKSAKSSKDDSKGDGVEQKKLVYLPHFAGVAIRGRSVTNIPYCIAFSIAFDMLVPRLGFFNCLLVRC
jgi:hypothetical protein